MTPWKNRKKIAFCLSAIGSAVLCSSACAQLRAFGDAEGFGALATGGRGGTVYHVTNLLDSGSGSFRDAVSGSNRIVVFDVGGVIQLTSGAISAKSNLTIAGQTAPGGGISITGAEVSFDSQSNDIIRYLRIHPGDPSVASDDALALGSATNIIVDHTSMEFAKWNNIDAVSDSSLTPNVTIQNSIIADPIDTGNSNTGQGFGHAHLEAVNGHFTLTDNLWANSHNRNPLAKVNEQFVNNIEYNNEAFYTTHTSTPFKHDLVNNAFIQGPAGGTVYFQLDGGQDTFYATGNTIDGNLDGVLNGSISNPVDGPVVSSPNFSTTAGLPTMSVSDAYNYVMAHVGASLTRDDVDSQVLGQVQTLGNGPVGHTTGTAGPDGSGGGLYFTASLSGLGNGGAGTIASSTRIAGFDADNDGIDDSWEAAHGLSSTNANDAKLLNPLGYSMIEQYINELGEINNTQASVGGASGEFSNPGNWNSSTLPGVMDLAQVRGNGVSNGSLAISSGTSTMMSLSIGGNGPASGESVTVQGGNLAVYNAITVGDQNNAALLINSGTINAYDIQLGNTVFGSSSTVTYTGSLTINGGVVQTDMIALGGGTPGAWTSGGSILFNGGTLSAVGSMTINTPITIGGAANIDTNGNDGTISGNITGAGTITKWDTGAISLTGSNNFNGALILKGGSVGITTDSNLGGASTSLSFQGGMLRINGTTLANIDSHPVNWSSFNGGFDINSASETFSVNSAISGAGSLTKAGVGALALTASNSFTGGTVLSAGTLVISDVTNVGGAGASISFKGGSLRILGTTLTNLDNMNVNWSSFNGGFDVNDPTNTFVVNQIIGGSGGLTKDGPGTLLLNAANTFTGNTVINAGVLKLGNALAIQNSTLNSPASGGALDLNGFALDVGGIAGGGAFDLQGGVLTVGDNNLNTTFSGVINDSVGGGKLVKTGTGTLTMTGSSSTNFNITVSQGGIAFSANVAASGNSPFGTGANAVTLDGGALERTGSSSAAWDRLFTLGPGGGTLDGSSGSFAFNSTGTVPFTGSGDRTLFLAGSQVTNELHFKLADPSSGKLSVTKVGGGRWIITVAAAQSWSYSGDTTISAGTLILNNASNMLPFGPGKGNLNVNGGMLEMNGRDITINGLNGSANVTNRTGTHTLNLGNGDASGAFSGSLSSGVSVVKNGAGVQVFSGTNVSTGTTLINGGVLQFNKAASIAGSTANVTVNTPGAAAAGYAMDQAFLSRLVTTSTGAAALALNDSNNLSMSSFANLSLGSVGSISYTGTLTPNTTAYRLGGGNGTLVLPNANALTGARAVQIFSGGTIQLNNSESYTGDTTINTGGILSLGFPNALPFGSGDGNVNLTGSLNLGNNNTNINALNGTGAVTQSGPIASSFTVGNANATGSFTGSISGGSNFSIIKTGTGSQTLLGANTWGGGTTVNSGTLILNNTNDGPINITGGAMMITAKANSLNPTGTSVVPSISITGGGSLDLTNNAAIIEYGSNASPADSVRQMIQSGAITSSLGDSHHHIGFAENSTLGSGSFGGASADGPAIDLRLTVDGDANLDGTVNILDFNQLAANFGSTDQIWGAGDFNYDGTVNLLDLNAIASDFGQSTPAPLPTLGALVPEPASMGMMVGLLFVARRRRSV